MAYDASFAVPIEKTNVSILGREMNKHSTSWVSSCFDRQFEVSHLQKPTIVLLFRRQLDSEQVAVLLGIDGQSQPGFYALPTRMRKLESIIDMTSCIDPDSGDLNNVLRPMGSVVQLQWHRVEVVCEIQFFQSYKISILDFNLEAIWNGRRDQGKGPVDSRAIIAISFE